jgi:hypothetical protein
VAARDRAAKSTQSPVLKPDTAKQDGGFVLFRVIGRFGQQALALGKLVSSKVSCHRTLTAMRQFTGLRIGL